MASSRAEEVAEILWELKRADKLAHFGVIAKRAGFSAGAKGRAMMTTMRTVRRDWPHLQWWRAVKDDNLLEKDGEQEEKLREAGYELADTEDEAVSVQSLEEHLMAWDDGGEDIVVDPKAGDDDDDDEETPDEEAEAESDEDDEDDE
ncbi:MAG: hypothetical protein O3A00_19695 [Planctomycetota bacterium]|nr:hypothetical protein [Planctomycetota bacterium]